MNWKKHLFSASVILASASTGHSAVIQVQSDIRDYEAIKTVSTGVLSTSNGVGAQFRAQRPLAHGRGVYGAGRGASRCGAILEQQP